MKKQRKPLDPRAKLALVIAGPLVLLVGGWMLLVGPQRSKAADLADQVASVQLKVEQAQIASAHPPKPEPIRAADIFRLAKAMPDAPDMPGIILQLNQVAEDSGIQFTSIMPHTPSTPDGDKGYQEMQIDLSFEGNFYGLSDFLYRLRNLVGVHGGELDATGRLFSVETLTFSEGKPAFPSINANLTLDAFIYGSVDGQSSSPVIPAAGATTTTATTTTTTTTSSDESASAAGATG